MQEYPCGSAFHILLAHMHFAAGIIGSCLLSQWGIANLNQSIIIYCPTRHTQYQSRVTAVSMSYDPARNGTNYAPTQLVSILCQTETLMSKIRSTVETIVRKITVYFVSAARVK